MKKHQENTETPLEIMFVYFFTFNNTLIVSLCNKEGKRSIYH